MIAFYLLVAIMPLVRHWLWSETTLAGLTLNKYLGIACLLIALWYLGQRRTAPRFFATLQAKVFVAFGLVTITSFALFGPSSTPVEVSPLSNWVSFLLLFFITVVLVDSLEKLRLVLLCLIGGVAFASAHLIREWIGFGLAAGERPGWVTGDPNYFALSALLCMPVALLMAQERGYRWQRVFCRGCLAMTLLAFTLAGSRGGFIGLVVAFVTVAWRSRDRMRFITLGGIALAALVLFSPTSPLTRLLEPTRPDIESTDVREALFWAGLRMFETHPLFGVGVGNFKALVGRYGIGDERLDNVAHNTYLDVGAEMGAPGLLAFLTILGATIRTVRRVRYREARDTTALLYLAAFGLEAGLLGGVVTILFLSALHVRIMWFVVILSMCLLPLTTPALRRAWPATCEPRGGVVVGA